MNIAELFVNLGIHGAEKTVGALGSVKKGLGDVTSMSLEAKAGILAVMYGLEHMMSQSGKTGTGLTNFAALTGLSAKTLQQWQYAALQAGVSSDELTGSLKGVQTSMTNMLLGKGAPEGLGIVAKAVGFDPKKARDSFYVMEQLQKAAQKLPQDVGNSVLKSFGLSEGTIAAMRRNAFTPAMLQKAPVYSDREVNQLDKANVAWANLGHHVEMAFGHFTAKHGVSLVGDITKIADAIFKMINAFEKLAEKLKLFQAIGKIFEGWTSIFNGVNSVLDKVTKDKNGVGSGLLNQGKGMMQGLGEAAKGAMLTVGDMIAPTPAPLATAGGANMVVNQNIVHHGNATDTKAVKDTHRNAINQAYRQRPAQRQGS